MKGFFSFRWNFTQWILPTLEGMKVTICLGFPALFVLLWIWCLVCSWIFRRHKTPTAYPSTTSPCWEYSNSSEGKGSNSKLTNLVTPRVTSRALQQYIVSDCGNQPLLWFHTPASRCREPYSSVKRWQCCAKATVPSAGRGRDRCVDHTRDKCTKLKWKP